MIHSVIALAKCDFCKMPIKLFLLLLVKISVLLVLLLVDE